jgi:SAM-dependent methyltransferase
MPYLFDLEEGFKMSGKEEKGESLAAAKDISSVDEMNAYFYGHIQYPGPVMKVERLAQVDLFSMMIGHDIGYWCDPDVISAHAKIWVAGCGRNQALITALRFPKSKIIGSDLSESSLTTCRAYAQQLGVENLELKKESINEITYREEFDYVICTGVIHHNADPAVPLAKLSRAMKPTGVLELMVYNVYHRLHTAAFQQVVRTFVGNPTAPDYLKELPLSKKLVKSFDVSGSMNSFLERYRSDDIKEAYFGDSLLQPVEHSYTIQMLENLAGKSNLEMLTFCVDQFSKTRDAVSWNFDLKDPELQEKYLALPDSSRWQITNLLLQEKSPMLWFYLQRQDCPRSRKTEQQICEEFLKETFTRIDTMQQGYILQADGTYKPMPRQLPFPGRQLPSSDKAQSVYKALDGNKPIGEIFDQIGLDISFQTVNDIRVRLATSAYPFIACQKLW